MDFNFMTEKKLKQLVDYQSNYFSLSLKHKSKNWRNFKRDKGQVLIQRLIGYNMNNVGVNSIACNRFWNTSSDKHDIALSHYKIEKDYINCYNYQT